MLPTRSFLDRDIWEGEYVDLWALVHLLNGVCFGFAIFFYDLPFKESFITFVLAIILWEIMEHYIMKAGETFPNQVIDVLAGALGFWATFKFVPIFSLSLYGQIILFTLIYIIVWTLAYYGFQSFALSSNQDLEKYKKSFSAAAIIYIAIMFTMFVF